MKFSITIATCLIVVSSLFAQNSDSILVNKTDQYVNEIDRISFYEPWIVYGTPEKKVDSIYLSSNFSDTIVHFIKLTTYFSKRNKIVTERFYYNHGELVKYCREQCLGDNLKYKISVYYDKGTVIRINKGEGVHFKRKVLHKALQTAKARFNEITTNLIKDKRLHAGWQNPPKANDEGWITYNVANTDSIYLRLKVKDNNNALDSNWMFFEIENKSGREVRILGKGLCYIHRMEVTTTQRELKEISSASFYIENMLMIPEEKTEIYIVQEDFWNNDLGLPEETYMVYMSLDIYLPFENDKTLYVNDFRYRFTRQKPDEK